MPAIQHLALGPVMAGQMQVVEGNQNVPLQIPQRYVPAPVPRKLPASLETGPQNTAPRAQHNVGATASPSQPRLLTSNHSSSEISHGCWHDRLRVHCHVFRNEVPVYDRSLVTGGRSRIPDARL